MSVTIDSTQERQRLHRAKQAPELVEVPELGFAMIDGHGDPNTTPAFGDAIQALYGVSYRLKFALKKERGLDYKVGPLEGLFWTAGQPELGERKDDWDWTLMIAQPPEVTPVFLARAAEEVAEAKQLAAARRLRLELFAEGRSAQVLHVGPYADEGPTIERLHAFIDEQGYARRGTHHEIYIGDPRRTAPERLKTIIRQPVAKSR